MGDELNWSRAIVTGYFAGMVGLIWWELQRITAELRTIADKRGGK